MNTELRVVRGDPTPEELAVITALATVSDNGARRTSTGVGRWNDPAARLRRPLLPGPGAWSASYAPR